ncbi:NAD-dependent epimerase/dehydratase family protein [Xanthobacter sp. V0B-10]|uniref:NAD-dependent epimerase/dehydratase family protein n=1 Tax=Xanthobacter albus TaxID=3119929 RepID=UPI00372C1A64
MTSLVVGASGLIGRRLCERLRHSCVGIIATTRGREERPAWPGVQWKALDFATFDAWDRLLEDVDTVYHLAWSTVPSSAANDPVRDVSENVVGTVRLLEAARRAPGVRIVFASSGGSVYGPPQSLPVDEAHPTRPIGAYGISKLTAEHYLETSRAVHGVDAIALRISNCYGPGQHEKKGLGAITLFARAALRRDPITLYGNGDIVRDFVHVEDVVSALVAAGERRNVAGPVNIGSGVGHSLRQVIAKLEAALGRPMVVQRAAPRIFDVKASVLDVSRARERIGWRPTIDLDRGIAMILEELRAEMGLECASPCTSTATTPRISTARKVMHGR